MVRARGLVGAAVAVAVLLMGLVATAGPAGAKKFVATGWVTCHVSQTFSFAPPLAPGAAGNPGVKIEKITISPAHFSLCSGSPMPANALPTSGVGTKATILKWKGIKIGSTMYAGSCLQFATFLWPKMKPHYNWSAFPARLKATKVSNVVEQGGVDADNNLGFLFSGTAMGSFAGTLALNDYLTTASSTALSHCVDNNGSVASLTTDVASSTITVGTGG
jgi:hypothetical protein